MREFRLIDRALAHEGRTRRHACGGWGEVYGIIGSQKNKPRSVVVILRCKKCDDLAPVFLRDVDPIDSEALRAWAESVGFKDHSELIR